MQWATRQTVTHARGKRGGTREPRVLNESSSSSCECYSFYETDLLIHGAPRAPLGPPARSPHTFESLSYQAGGSPDANFTRRRLRESRGVKGGGFEDCRVVSRLLLLLDPRRSSNSSRLVSFGRVPRRARFIFDGASPRRAELTRRASSRARALARRSRITARCSRARDCSDVDARGRGSAPHSAPPSLALAGVAVQPGRVQQVRRAPARVDEETSSTTLVEDAGSSRRAVRTKT